MAWSTSQLAELAGTTVKAVRHYHKLGLLDEPERLTNGYKQYEVAHLLRLLQITRLAELGLPLGQIAALGRADQDPDEALRVIDAELEATVERLHRIRAELAIILKHRAATDLPAGFGDVAGTMSGADRSLVMILSRVLDEPAMDEMKRMLRDEPRSEVDDEFDALSPDADLPTRRRLGERFAPIIASYRETYPSLRDPGYHAPRGAAYAEGAVAESMRELYNRAQLEVLYRAHLISTGDLDTLEELEATLAARDAGEH